MPDGSPLATGGLGEQAATSLDTIARRLDQHLARFPVTGLPASLYQGQAGLAVFYHHLGRFRSSPEDSHRARSLLAVATERVSDERMDPWLFDGFTGVAWAREHVLATGREPVDTGVDRTDEPGASIDRVIGDWLGRYPEDGRNELLFGLVGLGVYALSRLPEPIARIAVERIVDLLGDRAERSTAGVTWLTRPAQMHPRRRAQWPGGAYQIGVAHGVPGIVGFLALVCRSTGSTDRARELLEGSLRWIDSQRLPESAPSALPAFVRPGIDPRSTGLGWCWGDPGIAATILLAARSIGDSRWERLALDVARKAARRLPPETDKDDVSLCHGTAGLAHLFNRMYQITGDPLLGAAARAWLERTLELMAMSRGIEVMKGGRPTSDPGLIEGMSGVGLMLMGVLTTEEPTWDRLLLAS